MSSKNRCNPAHGLALLIGLLSLVAGGTAQADEEQARASAEALFKQGVKLVKEGDFEAGCPKFEAALERFESAATALNLGHCHKHFERSASALKAYRLALALASKIDDSKRRSRLEERARAGVANVEPLLAKLKIDIEAPQPPPDGLEVRYAGADFPRDKVGTAVPVDPGRAALQVRAQGYRPFEQEVMPQAGKTSEVRVVLQPLETLETLPESIPIWAWIAGASGVAFVATSVGFLVDQLDAIADLKAGCDVSVSPAVCTPGYDVMADNRRKNRSLGLSVGFGAAGALALGAAVAGVVMAAGMQEDAPVRAAGYAAPSLHGAIGWDAGIRLEGHF